MIKFMEKEDLFGKMEILMMENGLIMKEMEKELELKLINVIFNLKIYYLLVEYNGNWKNNKKNGFGV